MENNIIKEELLQVSIRTIKIGRKSLTKPILKQVPLKCFIFHHTDDTEIRCVGINHIEGNHEKSMDYFLDGQLLGFVNLSLEDGSYIQKFLMDNAYSPNIDYQLYPRAYYHIIFVNKENKLCRSYITAQQAKDLNLELEQIYI